MDQIKSSADFAVEKEVSKEMKIMEEDNLNLNRHVKDLQQQLQVKESALVELMCKNESMKNDNSSTIEASDQSLAEKVSLLSS